MNNNLEIALWVNGVGLIMTLLLIPLTRYLSRQLLKVTVKEAVETLGKALKQDEDLYECYHAHISMCFQDEMDKEATGTTIPYKRVANIAAHRLLRDLMD